jgi:beta-lactamase regulating signal transducer with metallopeptidase domain
MANFFENLFEFASFQSFQVLVLFVTAWVVCYLLRNASAHIRYLIWVVVIVKCFLPGFYRLEVPVLPVDEAGSQSAVSLSQERSEIVSGGSSVGVSAEPVTNGQVRQSGAGRFRRSGPAFDDVSFAGQDESAVGTVKNSRGILDVIKGLSMAQWGGFVYSAGILTAGGWFIIRAVLFSASLRNRRRKGNQIVLTEFEELCAGFGLQGVKLWVDEQAGQPYVWGLLRGDVYVPADFGADNNREHVRQVLAHELCHVRRFDAGVNILQVAAGILFWFHPLIWVANSMIRKERERCCDEAVIARLGTSPRSYSKAIVDVLTAEFQGTDRVPSVAVAGPVKNIEQRIKSLLRPGRKFSSGPGMFALVCVIIAAVLITPATVGICRRKCAEIEDSTNGYYIVRYIALAESPEVETRQKSINCKTKKEAEELVRKLKRSSKFKNARIEPDFKIYLPPEEFIGHWKGNTKSIMT